MDEKWTSGGLGASVRVLTPARILSEISPAFWVTRGVATALGQVAGEGAIQWANARIWGAIGLLSVFCLVSAVVARAARNRFPTAIFWLAIAAVASGGTALAEAADNALGIGDIGAALNLSSYLVLSFVLWHRVAGVISGLTGPSGGGLFFWVTAALAQALCSGLADWIVDPDGPDSRASLIVVLLGIVTVAGLYLCTPARRPALFWSAFIITGIIGALGGKAISMGARLVLH
ncbi:MULTISPECIES: hypothetical protein [unclassified Bradyrhizobium]|uniref:hypothetical protein n=1 Tax=unclassified Bradyrhizobium TaxID=2631580 RepID=UPI002479ADCD|nr:MULTISPECIES: hypothetical protein [unclassified Bradyrhizobium]WGR73780.1 hypothetical protein MTX24_13625 [Bradyrhizobium sp. ISRA426]WGR78618.1 hypothetical protein MTX21_38595 [Bradyrhizobium sp. ISRA430]WGR89019.1 hypothetical protein MTX25_13640 [Bradyrhizobium sp. ISRA432]